MKGKKVCCFVMAMQMAAYYYVAATSRSFPSTNGLAVVQPGPANSPESPQPTSKQEWNEVEVNHKGYRKIGSSPPSCEHKCYGCFPCQPIQVPTTSKHSHIGIQYTNYEPEGWKCKCGPSFYSP